jgi:DNA-binding GntR family transcriptional regulator
MTEGPEIFAKRLRPSQNTSTTAIDLIREAIVNGRLEPGRRLKEEGLAGELGISRTPVREALLVLAATEGLVKLTPNRGATVRSMSVEELEDAYDLKALLEGHAVHQAAERMNPRSLAVLEKSCARFGRLRVKENIPGLVKENLIFHNTVLDVAGSRRLRDMVLQVIHLPLVYGSFIWYSPEQRLVSEHYHKQLGNAFEAGDPERAELIMKEHVLEEGVV